MVVLYGNCDVNDKIDEEGLDLSTELFRLIVCPTFPRGRNESSLTIIFP